MGTTFFRFFSRVCFKSRLSQFSERRKPQLNILTKRFVNAMAMTDKKNYILPVDTDVVCLSCSEAFNSLSPKERQYAHYISQASWFGSLICLYQTSRESPGIFVFLTRLFGAEKIEDLKDKATEAGFTDNEFKALLIYAAGFFANMGNYKSFGDTKFVPDVAKDKLEKLVSSSVAMKTDANGQLKSVWEKVKEDLFDLDGKKCQLGLGEQGITTYFSSNCTEADAAFVQEFFTEKKLEAYNSRLFKTSENGSDVYEIRLASFKTSVEDKTLPYLGRHEFKGKDKNAVIHVTRGDYTALMQLLADNLEKAQDFVANDCEREMLKHYVTSFRSGELEQHKEGSRHWIRNKGPIIETYIGFIESYRDPYGVRGEFEGFVAMVNKEMSQKFQRLVENAEKFLPLLPWPSSFEKDEFLRPDFTSLDVLTYGSSGIPAGINIPNYDDIRQSEGFKNVSLGNVLSSGYKDTKLTFLNEADKALMAEYRAPSFEIQVGLHELLGHGSGKLLMKDAAGKFNFDQSSLKHPETGEKISTWYEASQTWDSVFSTVSSSYEECRAECVGIYLCLDKDIVKIFGYESSAADDVIYVNWLTMARAGLLALEYFTPENKKWRQAHMQARFVILRVLLEAGNDLVKVEETTGDDGQPDLLMTMDRSRLETTGKEAIGNFLRKLQVYKATADTENGIAMYNQYSIVDEKFLKMRETVMARKLPRKMFVQCNTVVTGDTVALKTYEPTAAELIKSNIDRFPIAELQPALLDLWNKDSKHFAS